MNSDEAASDSVLARAASGSRYTLLTQLARLACKAFSVVVIARLVSPDDHGLYAMAASVTMFLFLFLDLGLGTAVVQSPTLTPAQLTALFRIHLVLGIALGLASIALAPLAAQFFEQPELTALISAMSVGFLINAAGGTSRALLQRQLRFKEINRLETSAALLATAAAVTAASLGAGAYTFAIFLLVSETVTTALAWFLCPWRPQPLSDFQATRTVLENGWRLTRYHMLNYAVQQIDSILLGLVSGAHALGLYNRAAQLLTLPLLHVAAPLSRVAIAAMSRLHEDHTTFRRQAVISANLIAHLTLPLVAFAIAAPVEIVHLILGSQWPAAAPVLRWLAVSAAITHITHVAYAICIAAGTARRLTPMAFVALPIVLLAVWFGARTNGPSGVAIALSVTNLALAFPRLAWSLHSTPVHVSAFLAALRVPVTFALVLTAAIASTRALAVDFTWPWRLLAAFAGLTAASVAGWLLSSSLRAEWRNVRTHLPRLRETTKQSSF